MNLQKVFLVSSLSLITLGNFASFPASTFAQTSSAPSDAVSVVFFCKVVDGVPNTIARVASKSASSELGRAARTPSDTVAEEAISVFQWRRKDYPESKESPLERCTRVSTLLQAYRSEGKLNYISSGLMDEKKVICAASGTGSPCSRLLFVLEPEEESEEEIQKLLKELRKIISDPALPSDWKLPRRGGKGQPTGAR